MLLANENIYIDRALLKNVALMTNLISTPHVLIVTDHIVANLHLASLLQPLAQYKVDVLKLKTGEANKTWSAVESILQTLAVHQHDRSSTIISLGGGIIGDLTGLAASLYMRGINWLQIPTTLLAQVDAAIGGKTGCNYLGVKNLIGTFYQPKAVLVDLDMLHTLPVREFRAGLAEVVKYGFVCDAEFFCWLEAQKQKIIQRDQETLQYMIGRCCEIKQSIVATDVHEHKQRMILNFGHSFGHAIEAATDFKIYLHGEAVAIGMLLASRLAVKLGLLDRVLLDRLVNLLTGFGLSLDMHSESCNPNRLLNFMKRDKKKRAGMINLILPCGLGQALVMPEHEIESLEDALQDG